LVSSKGGLNPAAGIRQPPGMRAPTRPLADVVRDAADQLVTLIPDARLRLDLLTDPDYGEGEQLFLGVSTHMQDEDALEALRRFDQEWWVHHIRRARGLLCIDLSDG